ncbi:MAG: hypothetical protein ACRDSF_23010 [Pseudonocardiaceae bacterium]
MSGIGSSPPLAPLTPMWSIDYPETLLWRGAGRVTGQRAERETELVATWQPELDVRQEPDDAEDSELLDLGRYPDRRASGVARRSVTTPRLHWRHQ